MLIILHISNSDSRDWTKKWTFNMFFLQDFHILNAFCFEITHQIKLIFSFQSLAVITTQKNLKLWISEAFKILVVDLMMVPALMLLHLVSQPWQTPSERVWAPKEWTRWSVNFWFSSFPVASEPHMFVKELFLFVCFRSRMRKVTWPSPTTAPPSWSRCRFSTLQPRWYAPLINAPLQTRKQIPY